MTLTVLGRNAILGASQLLSPKEDTLSLPDVQALSEAARLSKVNADAVLDGLSDLSPAKCSELKAAISDYIDHLASGSIEGIAAGKAVRVLASTQSVDVQVAVRNIIRDIKQAIPLVSLTDGDTSIAPSVTHGAPTAKIAETRLSDGREAFITGMERQVAAGEGFRILTEIQTDIRAVKFVLRIEKLNKPGVESGANRIRHFLRTLPTRLQPGQEQLTAATITLGSYWKTDPNSVRINAYNAAAEVVRGIESRFAPGSRWRIPNPFLPDGQFDMASDILKIVNSEVAGMLSSSTVSSPNKK